MLESFISDVKRKFSHSQQGLRNNVESDLYKNVPRCCIVENENLIDKVIHSKDITFEDVLALCSKIKIPKQTKKQLQKLANLSSPNLEELSQSIQLLQEKYKDRFRLEYDRVTYITEPIVLKGAELGRFQIHFDLELLSRTIASRLGSIIVQPLEPNERNGYAHPHIESTILCSGDAQAALFTAVVSLDIIAFFEIVEAVLNTYNPESPYTYIEEWIGYACSDCGEAGLEESKSCVSCDNLLCDDCSLFCEGCEEYFCVGCYCQGKDMTQLRCVECRGDRCLGCWEDTGYICNSCGSRICQDCNVFTCESCDEIFCSNCEDSDECENCKETFCAECFKEHRCEKEEE